MKRIISILIVAFLVLASACETENENETRCFPSRMSSTIVGGETRKVTADFFYIPETELLEHITWSDKQTYYYEYDEYDMLKVVRLKKIDFRIQEELWFSYSGNELSRIDLCIRQLNNSTLEPIEGDSTYTGYHLFEYNDGNIIAEQIYSSEDGKKEILFIQKTYEYDDSGNITRYFLNNLETKAEEDIVFTYHDSKHPFSNINLYFTGESFINNIQTKTDEAENLDYTYVIEMNLNGYPDQIVEKINGSISTITQYSYFCK